MADSVIAIGRQSAKWPDSDHLECQFHPPTSIFFN